ncbi:BCCT family transporter [Marinobacter fonticola]|uniref:BCCT family transporter n=1 Tax=Marinobacter fonticola TaxID=2603215 RepID=UPI0011E60B0E|nr:BCCT family transporter [Marinobacter fonticola]
MAGSSDKGRYGSTRKNNLMGIPVQRRVFIPAALIIMGLALAGIVVPSQLESGAKVVQDAIANGMGWFYLLAMNVFLIFALYLIFGRYGDIRLGGVDRRPDFSSWGWYSMLFAAGTGVGLLFYGVAGPVSFFANPPFGEPQTEQAARDALVHSFFHWGFHGWSMYALVGLAMGFFCYNRDLPLTVRSAFYPLLGERVNGRLGAAIDVVAVVGTLFGVAVSLGLGVEQMNTGLAETFSLPQNKYMQVGLIGGVTAIATISVVTGLDQGIQKLSKLAMVTGGILGLYVLIAGPTQFLFHAMIESVGSYIQQIPSRGTYAEAFKSPDATQWQNEWTLFYFAWWISWSPFVGMFIARISRGRTIREYMLGVLFVPTIVSMVWLTIMGGTALYGELYQGSNLAPTITSNAAKGTFQFLQNFPVPEWVSLGSMMVLIATVAIFFITSSDSGSLVIDIITSGGDLNPPTSTRVFWAILEGVVASVLLVAGGLKALQSVATIAGFPFVILLLLMCLGLLVGLKQYRRHRYELDGERLGIGERK